MREQLAISIEAARRRGEALDHVLIFGPPGLGKTTLSHVIANELGVNLRSTSGPVLERPGDLAALLTNLQPRDVLFVDEIHRLSPIVEEVLYPAIEDFQIDIMIGEGPAARSIKLDLPPFTLIGATTRAGLLTAPLRDRFGIVQRLEFYSALTNSPRSCAARRDPRHRLRAGRRAGDRAPLARHAAHRQPPAAPRARLRRGRGGTARSPATSRRPPLEMLKVDAEGFDEIDRRLLGIIIENFDGGPVGVESLAAALCEDRGTIEDVLEPFLIQQGFLVRTARGRMVTAKAWRHMGLTPPQRVRSRWPPDLLHCATDPRCLSTARSARRPSPSPGRCASTGKTPTPAASSITRATCISSNVRAANGCVRWVSTRCRREGKHRCRAFLVQECRSISCAPARAG